MTTPPLRSPLLRGRGRPGLRSPAPMVNIHESVPAQPDPSSFSPDAWRRLEGAAFSVMHKIQPTVSSENLRARVISYLQRLFKLRHDGYQVIPFGSVPFKTYLPDGDIDLTLLHTAISDENIEKEVRIILNSEEQRKGSEFEVKDVMYVPAEVKLVKCKVQNIAVDISFNQIGGCNKLYFLEKVDQYLGKNNLLRRSIILIKHWCYYESRILGAQSCLISTYALETLVLYIFHIFHKSLDGPLAVLYRFLDYYSKFDWDNKGISLFGPVSLSSLPELVTEQPDTRDDGFVQREKFLKDSAQAFSVPPINSEKNLHVFSKKFLNIVDPLKQSNNLGRSVNKGNFGRIRREFYNGACKLGKILQAPASFSVNEINRFFGNTLNKADVLASSSYYDVLLTANNTNDSLSPGLDVERINKISSPSNSCDVLCNQFSYIKISDSNCHGSVKQKECNSIPECKKIKSVSWSLPDSDARSHGTTTDSVGMINGGDFSGAQHLLFQTENDNKVDVRVNTYKYHKEFSGSSPPQLGHNNDCSSLTALVDDLTTSDSVLTPKISQWGGTTNNTMPNLGGGSGIHLHNLLYARGFQQDSPSRQLYKYPMHAKNGAAVVPGPLDQTDDHMAMRAHGTGKYFPDSNLLVDRPHAVEVNTRANDHGTTPLAAAASSSTSSTPHQSPLLPPEPASPSPRVDWPGGGAQQAGADCRGHGLEGNAGGVKGAGLVGHRGDAGVGAMGPAAPVAVHAKARKRRPRTRGRR